MLWFRTLLTAQSNNLKNLIALVFFNFLAAGLFFITQIKVANVIGKMQFGLLAYGIALGMYTQAIVGYGMNRTLVRDLIHKPDQLPVLVIASLVLRLIIFGLVVITLLIWKIGWHPSDLTWPVITVIIAYSLKSIDLQPVYDTWHCMARHASYYMIQRGLYVLIIWGIVFSAIFRLNLTMVAAVLLVTEILYLFIQQRWAFRRINFAEVSVYLASTIREMFQNNWWVAMTAVGILSFSTLNQIILKHYAGASELGIYAAPWQIVAGAGLLLGQVGRLGNPATARITRPEINTSKRILFILKYSCIMVATALPIVIPTIMFPDWIMKSFFSPAYSSSAPILRLFGIYIIIFSLGLVAAQYIVSVRLERIYFISVAIGGLTSLILCMVLIPQYGGLGAAISLLISHGSTMGLYWMIMLYQLRRKGKS